MLTTGNLPPLSRVLAALGDSLVELLAAPLGVEVGVREVVIVDPDDDLDLGPGDLVLAIGLRGRAAVPLLRAAGRAGVAAVAIKVDTNDHLLRDAAVDAGVALLAVHASVRWVQLASLAGAAVQDLRRLGDTDAGELPGDLFSLAQTIAILTGGIVSIEDTANRVLAYSRSADEVDELRRLSILGRQGPEPYLKMLREWGVYRRLRAGEDVVRVDEHPELGIRRRLAVGIFAGDRPLGTIWVQEGGTPLSERAERALLGAARVTALHLVRRRHPPSPTGRLREELLHGLLDGRLNASAVAEEIGADPAKPAVVLAFALHPEASRRELDRAELELRRSEMTRLIAVHAAAYRRSALVTTIAARTYALLPELSASGGSTGVLTLAKEIVAASHTESAMRVQAGIGSVVSRLTLAADSRAEADQVLDALARSLGTGGGEVATVADVRGEVLLARTLELLAADDQVRDPRLTMLYQHDREHGGLLAASLSAYLDAFGDVRAAAAELGVHPNTVRYRVRRAAGLTGIDLASATERLVLQLQLRIGRAGTEA